MFRLGLEMLDLKKILDGAGEAVSTLDFFYTYVSAS